MPFHQDSTPQACANGEEEDLFTSQCVPHTVPSSPAVPAGTVAGTNDVPTIDGVPCEGARGDAQCRGLAEEQVPGVTPSATVNGQPVT